MYKRSQKNYKGSKVRNKHPHASKEFAYKSVDFMVKSLERHGGKITLIKSFRDDDLVISYVSDVTSFLIHVDYMKTGKELIDYIDQKAFSIERSLCRTGYYSEIMRVCDAF